MKENNGKLNKLEASSIKIPQSSSWYLLSSFSQFSVRICLREEKAPRGERKYASKEKQGKARKGQEKQKGTRKAKEGKDQAASAGILAGNRLHV